MNVCRSCVPVCCPVLCDRVKLVLHWKLDYYTVTQGEGQLLLMMIQLVSFNSIVVVNERDHIQPLEHEPTMVGIRDK